MKTLATMVFVLGCGWNGLFAAGKPLKVFILAGQSNMEGHAKVSTFDYIGLDPKTAPILKEMRNDDGTPKVFDKIPITYLTGMPKTVVKNGSLTVGYGALANGPKIGPEYTFGIYMHKLLGEPILLIKTAWGGKSLHTDFRPPSAGPYVLNDYQKELYAKQKKDLAAWQAEKDKITGHYYRLMINHVKSVLKDVKTVYPAYDEAQGCELAGFVWFQGWNDMCDSHTYPKGKEPGRYDEYSKLFAHFIRDVRKDLNAPKLPFVIGVLGVGGEGQMVDFRKAMEAPALMDEFKGAVTAVRTEVFWDHTMETLIPKQKKVNELRNTAHAVDKDGRMQPCIGWKTLGTPEPATRIWRYTSFDPTEEKDKMPVGTPKRFRAVTLPKDLADWYTPEFDDSTWKSGNAPIGKGVWKRSGKTIKGVSEWGDGEFILMRTTFDVDRLDYEKYRLSILSRQGFQVYLNGHKIHTYIWWMTAPYYRSIVLGENEVKHLKKGRNVLAIYANHHCDKRNPEPYNTIDAAIEGITKGGLAEITAEENRILPPAEKAIVAGSSNAGYHYLGSGKIMAQIGKAFAEAMVTLQKK